MDEKGDEMAKMTVYHGGYMAVEHPEIRKGRNTKDFGTGFYCTIIKEQAQRWAKRYDTKIVSIYDVRLDSSLKIKIIQSLLICSYDKKCNIICKYIKIHTIKVTFCKIKQQIA